MVRLCPSTILDSHLRLYLLETQIGNILSCFLFRKQSDGNLLYLYSAIYHFSSYFGTFEIAEYPGLLGLDWFLRLIRFLILTHTCDSARQNLAILYQVAVQEVDKGH